MSTAADTFESEENPEVHTEFPEHSNKHYLVIALALAIITGFEVALTYMDIGAFFLPLLLTLMMIKFVMVVMEFMHLRHDASIFKALFWSGFSPGCVRVRHLPRHVPVLPAVAVDCAG
jgi:cytochrome c oxidase subunit IV